MFAPGEPVLSEGEEVSVRPPSYNQLLYVSPGIEGDYCTERNKTVAICQSVYYNERLNQGE